MENLKIEKNIPIPPIHTKSKWVDLLKSMEIGDSFLMDGTAVNALNKLRYSIDKLDIKVTARTLPNGKARVWRVK